MDTTCSSIVNLDSLNVFVTGFYTIRNLQGIHYFKTLKKLNSELSTAIMTSFQDELPATLTHLHCNGFRYLTSLPALPPGLRYLDMSNVAINALPALPNSLQWLNVSSCVNLTALPALPPNLKWLNTTWCINLMALPALPVGLKYIEASNCGRITYLPTLPLALDTLICSNCQLTSLPALPSSLTYLDCSNNCFTTGLPALPQGLKKIICRSLNNAAPIISMPSLPNSLTDLDCAFNHISSLPALPPNLKILRCGINLLTSVPTLPGTLTELWCDSNRLQSLPALNDSLQFLVCRANQLSALPPLPIFLTQLECSNNPLTTLPALPQRLSYLRSEYTSLTQLPSLPPYMRSIYVNHNQLTSLPALPASLAWLECRFNNIYCLPKIPNWDARQGIAEYRIDDKIKCKPNDVASLFVTAFDSLGYVASLPLCQPTNNIYNCQSFPVIKGKIFYDVNGNGIQDAGEPSKGNARVSISPSNFTFTNSSGYFEIGADSIGTCTITITSPNYYAAVPAAHTYTFTSYDTVVTGNFALNAATAVDSIQAWSVAWNRSRPGFPFYITFACANAGTTTLSPVLSFRYDTTKLVFDSCANPLAVHVPGLISVPAVTLAPFESSSNYVYFRVKTTAVIGDSLISIVTATANSIDYSTRNRRVIGGSFDPNDKEATARLTPSEMQAGRYIDYTIRFQNTGTDTAFNVVIKDELSSYLQYNSLEVVAASHTCKTTLKGNTIYFEFLNILLPDSNVSEPKSLGFISFRVKPKALTTIVNVYNNADIYFDYNSPIRTNTVKTVVNEMIVLPLKLISFSAVLQNDNSTTLYWNTANEINTKQFVIEQSSDGARFNSITNVFAKGKANNNYSANVADANNSFVYYRLKIIDNDGNFAYSPIIKIDRRKNSPGFSILTNPVKDFIIINTTDKNLNNTQADIINMQGAVVKNFIIKEGSQTLGIKDLPSSIYYLRTVKGNSKFLKQ
jgi:uncharacterized repeat protein (TIGR01451 family)